jgi:adenylate cyclase
VGNKDLDRKKDLVENWYWYLTGENKDGFSSQYELNVKWFRRTSGLFPGAPRCIECNLPMSGLGAWLTATHPSSFSPRLCSKCEQAMRKEEAGAEVELSMLFADVRGSTTLAETTTPAEFKRVIQQFYRVSAEVLVRRNAMVNRLMGDQVIGLFVPRFAGSRHAEVAIETALDIMRATGHVDREGPWIPVGIGVHTGLAYVGAVGRGDGVNEIAVLGSAPNLAARLSSQAADGEVIVSETAAAAAGLDNQSIEPRQLDLKGINSPVAVRVLRIDVGVQG